ncbi:uncharacterized protein LOC128961498 [Oppia nitens]|uniref:uncharacterized protein LOC128961498 n=1 Tax=Oppia nitens TaxID=1686743 RepID=UPI0023DBA9C2|nr:uncharacterized protein LOC128961498 [Oppia nitens]
MSLPMSKKDKDVDLMCDDIHKTKANACADKLWFVGHRSRKYPENEPELEKHCKETANLIKCVKDYTDVCGNEVHRQLANVMLYTVKTLDRSYCTKSSKKTELMSFSVCGNHIRDQSNKCMDQFMIALGKSSAYTTKLKVPHACCAFHNLKSCIMSSAFNDNKCNEKTVDLYEKYISSMASNTVNMMCSDYEEDSDKCQHLPHLPKGTKYSKALSVIDGFGSILD